MKNTPLIIASLALLDAGVKLGTAAALSSPSHAAEVVELMRQATEYATKKSVENGVDPSAHGLKELMEAATNLVLRIASLGEKV